MTQVEDAKLIRDWLEAVIQRTGLKATPLAKEAGLAPSTLLRALDQDNPTALERRSIAKIVAKFGVPSPFEKTQKVAVDFNGAGFGEEELIEFDHDVTTFAGEVLTPNQYIREINTRALELSGHLLGDLALLDMSVTPAASDIVAANVYNLQRGSAETILRLYEAPYLVTRSMDQMVSSKPLLVDDERVKIMAVVIAVLRRRRSSFRPDQQLIA